MNASSNMNEKKSLPNPSHVQVDTSVFIASHGKLPRGRGFWAFSPDRHPKDCSDREKVYFTGGSYAEAKRAAQCRFANFPTIYVQP